MRQLFITIGLLTSLMTLAENLSEQEAFTKAIEFVGSKTAMSRGASRPQLTVAERNSSGYYVFNIADSNGFVIVGGSESTNEIIGYSDTGVWDPSNLPNYLRVWIQGYSEHLTTVNTQDDINKENARWHAVSYGKIDPLLTTQWNQESPYNQLCPKGTDKKPVPTGCVATAMSQLMYYHRYPTSELPSLPSYTSKSASLGQVDMPGLSASSINWEAIYPTYTNGENSSEVAKLMLYCGTATQMNYGQKAAGGSSTWAGYIPQMLVEYFGYDKGAKYVSRNNYNYAEWITLIYNELQAQRPVLLSGQSTGGGHAFICDGYDTDDYFHFNWGWGGQSDGFFKLSLLNPDKQGAGGTRTTDGFNMSLMAAIGIQPDTGITPDAPVELSVKGMNIADTGFNRFVRENMEQDFCVSPSVVFTNQTGTSHDYNFGVRLIRNNGTPVKDFIWAADSFNIANNVEVTMWSTVYFGAGLPAGTYHLIGIYREAGTDEWKPCELSSTCYIEVTIRDDNVSMTIVEPPTYSLEVQSVNYTHDAVKAGEPETVSIVVKNKGGAAFHGEITFDMQWTEDNILYGEKWGGSTEDIEAGQTVTITIVHTPVHEGPVLAKVYQGLFNRGVVLREDSIIVTPGDKWTDAAELTLAMEVVNAFGNKILSTSTPVKIILTNESDVNYEGNIFLWTYLWKGNEARSSTYPFRQRVPAHSTVEVIRNSDDLIKGSQYSFAVSYTRNNVRYDDNTTIFTYYTPVAAYRLYNINNEVTSAEATSEITIPEDAVAVDLRGQKDVKLITPNTNPNTLYLMDEGATVPDGVTHNVVEGTTATNIILTDGYDFYPPIDFTALNISYCRTFANGTDGTGGWSTLMLPFEVSRIESNGTALDWYHNADEVDKNLWIERFNGDGEKRVNFVHESSNILEAYTPYLIAVPGEAFGPSVSLTGHQLTFYGSNAELRTDARAMVNGDYYRFAASTYTQNLGNVWRLDLNGIQFEKITDIVMPFRAYFLPMEITHDTPLPAPAITPLPATDGIATLHRNLHEAEIYHLDGTKAGHDFNQLPKGIYISNGKKFIK